MVAFAAIAAAATVASTAYSLSKGAGGTPTSTSTQSLEFPEETRRLFQDVEEPLLKDSLSQQSSLMSPFLGGNAQFPFLQSTFGQPPANLALAAGKRGAKDAGITNLGPLTESLGGLPTQFVENLRQLVLQNAAQRTTVVPPGYGQFLAPATFSQTQGAGPDPLQTGFQLAASIGTVASKF